MWLRKLFICATVLLSLQHAAAETIDTDFSAQKTEGKSLEEARHVLMNYLEKRRLRKDTVDVVKVEGVQEKPVEAVKLWVVPPDPQDFESWKTLRKDQSVASADKQHFINRPKAFQSPTVDADSHGAAHENAFTDFDKYTNSRGILTRPRSRSPFTKPGLWEPNPDDPHSRDPANKYWYHPESVGVDWLNGQIQWGAHWAVPAAGAGGTDGMSAIHFPTIGNFLNIPDDYD